LAMAIPFALLLSNGFTYSSTGSGASWPVPTGWADAPGNLSMYPYTKSDTGVTIIDPWLYEHRLGAYKITVSATQVKGKAWWGNGSTGDILWGLPLQFGWQHDSGRLKPQGTDDLTLSLPTVSPTSWWACMNWVLSIIPFSGALEAGIIEWPIRHREILFQRPNNNPNASRFCSSPSECASVYPKLMSKWTTFFHHLASDPSYTATSRHGSAEISKEEDELLGYLWDAHTASIHTGLSMFGAEASLLPLPEREFGLGWANLVEIIAATRWPPDFNSTSLQQAQLLPPRMLHDGDVPPFIKDFPPGVNAALAFIQIFWDTNKDTGGRFVADWKRAMCTFTARKVGRALLNDVLEELKHPAELVDRMLEVVADFITLPCPNATAL